MGAADRNTVIAGCRMNPDVLKSGLPCDTAVGHAVQRDPAGDTQIFGAGCFAQPPRARKQHVFSVVLNPPGEILPMPHRWTAFPPAAVHNVRLPEVRSPMQSMQCAVVNLN